MPLDPGDANLLRNAVQEAVESAQEKLAQMVAKQFVEIRTDIQVVQDAVHKVSAGQIRVEADLNEVGHNCEWLKRRLSDLHDGLGQTTDRPGHDRDLWLRVDLLEREVAELKSRLV